MGIPLFRWGKMIPWYIQHLGLYAHSLVGSVGKPTWTGPIGSGDRMRNRQEIPPNRKMNGLAQGDDRTPPYFHVFFPWFPVDFPLFVYRGK